MTASRTAHAAPHPAVYLVLYVPFGISAGYVTVTLAWLLGHAGVSVAAVAAVIGVSVLPNTWKVLWAPLVDTTLSTKWWFMISIVTTEAGMAATSFLPLQIGLLPTISALVLALSLAGTISAITVDRIMAFDTPDHLKGQAGGWSQAGNLGGGGLGGGAGLWIATHGHPWMAGLALALISAACALPLLWLTEPGSMRAEGERYRDVLTQAARDVWTLVRTRIGLLACFILLLPIGTGGASQLWAVIAKDWRADADQVALVGGLLSGLISIPGAIAGGWLADRIDRKAAYVVAGILSAASAVILALGPHTPMAFVLLASLYNLVIGLCYGTFSAVTLEAIGKGAAGTKYNLMASLSNMPLLLMTLVDGWAETRWGAGGMLWMEAGVGAAGVLVYYAVEAATRGRTWPALRRATQE